MQPKTPHPPIRPSGGFTLIEMMAVVAIIAMIFAVGIPRLNASKLRALENDAESIASSLEFARQRAIMTRTPHRVLIDLEEGGYRVEWLVDEDRAFAAGSDEDEDLALSDLAPDGPSSDRELKIHFHPPPRGEREFYPIPSSSFGSFIWLDDARYFVGLDSTAGWVEGGDVEIVFDADGTTAPARLEIADADDNHLTLEIEPLFDRVRRREGGARS